MTAQRVLVTGATGFIGRRVVRRFQEAGWTVIGFGLPGETEDSRWLSPIELRTGDLRNVGDVERAVRDVDVVVHLAAIVGSDQSFAEQQRVTAEGTRLIAQAAARIAARLVVTSSICVYGDLIQTGALLDEDAGFGTWQGSYGYAKQEQERVAQEVARQSGLQLTLVRPANVYGLFGPGNGRSIWGEGILAVMRAGQGAVIGDGGRNDAGLVYVDNLGDALFAAATETAAIGRTYNVCDENGVTWRRFLEDMAGLAGVEPPPLVPLEPFLECARANENPAALVEPVNKATLPLENLNLLGFSNRFSSARIRTELGWTPRLTYDAAMDAMRAALVSPTP